tara:strand:- start:375 stop:1388 length:1014 start_codon:yes stop_codon:yes gene_type:complete
MTFSCSHLHSHDIGKEIVSKQDESIRWDEAEQAVNRRVPAMVRLVKRYIDGIKSQVSNAAIDQVVRSGNPDAIVGMFEGLPTPSPELLVQKTYDQMVKLEDEISSEMLDELVSIAAVGGEAGWASIPVAVQGSFNINNPYVIPELQERVGWLITEVRNSTNLGIRDQVVNILSEAYEQQLTQVEAGRRIRDVIGLRPDQVNALAKVEERLVAGGMQGERLANRMAREATKRLNYRADMIARTELRRAMSSGRHAAWKQARDEGFFGSLPVYVRWVAGMTDRTCPVCADLNGTTEQLGANFTSSEDIPAYASVNGEMPPVHPLCRCTTVLEVGPRRLS